MKKPKMMLCRVSSTKNDMDLSLKSQEELVKKYAETHSIKIAERWANNTRNGESK